MVGRCTVVGAALLLLVISNTLSSVDAEPSLKDLMLQDQAAKQHAHGGPASTQKPAAPTQKTAAPTQKTAAPTQKTAAPTQKPAAPTQKPAAPTQKPAAPKESKPKPTEKGIRSPSAAPAFAHIAQPFQAPIKQGSGGGSAGGHAALGTSAMIGIGVGVGVACLVAVGAVVGVLVHLRRRKSKGTQLEKQKTYGGTE